MILTSGLTKHRNVCKSQFIQQVLPIYILFEQDTPMAGKDDDVSENFGLYKDEESILKEQEMEGDQRDLVGKSLNIGSCAIDGLSGHIPQVGVLVCELSSSLREVRLNKQEFLAGKPESNIKYHYPGSQNNDHFYLFND